MNKQLIAAAIAAAVVAAPAAYADATVYGKIHTSVDAVDHDEFGTADDVDNYKVENRSSRLGFKGAEDLGNGLKAIYQIEFGIRSDGGDAQSAGDGHTTQRNTFVGLAGDFGTLLVGRHDTPAKMAFYASGNDRLGDSIIDLNTGGANPIGVFSEVRANNVVAYVSPNFSGFTLAAAAIPGEESGIAPTDADGFADHVSIGAMYSGYGLKASVGYEELDDQALSGGGNDQEMWQAGASYTFNNLSVGVQYENSDNYQAVSNEEFEAWGVTARAEFGNNAVSAIYTMAELDNAAGVQIGDFDGWGIAAEHNFSKRTKAYVAYATGEDEGAAAAGDEVEEDRFSLGMIHNF